MLACWIENPNGDYFKKHLARIPDYMWVAEDGMKMQVTENLIIFGICCLVGLGISGFG